MRFILAGSLAVACLLASASSIAHAAPPPAPASHSVVITHDAEAAAFTGSTVSSHPTVSVHVGSFHSAPIAHSFSVSPSRTFTFSTRPAATVPTTRIATAPTAVQHFTNTGSSGLSPGSTVALHQALGSRPYQVRATQGPEPPDEGLSGWAITGIVGGIVIIVGVAIALFSGDALPVPDLRQPGGRY